MANSGSFSTNAYQNRTLDFYWWTNSTNIGENYTEIGWKIQGGGSQTQYFKTGNFKVVIDGEEVFYKSEKIQLLNGTVVAEGTKRLYHNSDGTKSFSASAECGIYQTAVNARGSGSWTIDNIPRYSNITSAPNFNDEENPTITFTNPSNYYSLRAKIEAGGHNPLIYRDLASNATSCTFNFSESERNLLRNLCPNSNTLSVRFTICAMNGNTELSASYLDKTMTIVNANPTISPSITDVNSVTTALTGDSSKLVKYFSNAKVYPYAAARKGASIAEYNCKNGATTKTGSSMTFNAIESNLFSFYARDTRGNITIIDRQPIMIDYIRLTINLSVNIDVTGKATFNIKGNYFNGNFGSQSNTLEVKYRYKEQGGTYSEWTAATASVSGNTYTASPVVTGLNYHATYVFQAQAADVLTTINSNELSTKALPVFDWNKDDFNINVNFKINGNSFLDLVYPVGSIYMSVNSTSPEILFGGSWEAIGSRFLIGAGAGEPNTTDYWGSASAQNLSMPAGEMGGEYEHILSEHEMPSHKHNPLAEWGTTQNLNSNAADGAYAQLAGPQAATKEGTRFETTYTGGNGAHKQMPPYLVVYMWKRLPETSYSVSKFGTGYDFTYNSNGYYESQNKGVDNSWAMCKVSITTKAQTTATISYISHGENNYDFGIFSNLDTELSNDNNADTTGVYKSCKGEADTAVKTLTYNIPAGNHYITVKFRKDSSSSSGNDSLQFKVNLS